MSLPWIVQFSGLFIFLTNDRNLRAVSVFDRYVQNDTKIIYQMICQTMLAPLTTFLEAPTYRAEVQDFFASDDEANSISKFFLFRFGSYLPLIYQTI